MGSDYMRDLLQKFSETKHPFEESTLVTPKTEEVELNLGLSLGGCFGTKPRENSLYRSSSIACSSTTFMNNDIDLSLTRTSSLPSETLEETRKRKGVHSVMDMDGMKSRSENQKSFKGAFTAQGIESMGSSLPLSWGSIGSQGTGSSGISEGPMNRSGSRSPASVLSLPEEREQKPIIVPCPKPERRLDNTAEHGIKSPMEKPTRESEAQVMEEMPCVFTKGDGPHGKRIEGLLFKYKKGEEVKIVCVCHGSFLSPAEFVKHAGGGDVAYPLKHIVVAPSPSSFL